MKTKTINAVLCKKFDDFLESIMDDKVKSLIEVNTIITGGCIASMLLKEDVNDFDIYFTNKETVKAVAEYYVAKFKGSHEIKKGEDVSSTEMYVEEKEGRIKIYIKSAGVASEKSDDNEYQYFEQRPPEEAEDYISEVVESVKNEEIQVEQKDAKPKYRPVFLSANAITLSGKMQIVIRFYGDPETIHQHYDYIHCTNYWTSKDRKLVLKQPALEALLSKELVYVGSKYPICSVIRTRKFIKRGWTINAGQYLKMCWQISELNLGDINVLEDQLTGVDAAYFAQLVEGLKKHSDKQKEEGKEFKIEYGYLASIIDKIF